MPSRSRFGPYDRLDEFQFIEDLLRRFGRTGRSVIRGIGDDAAILQSLSRRPLLITTDLLAEHIHFDLATASAEDVGYKAAVANLSDIAAMGGKPEYLLAAIAVPSARTKPDLLRLYRGLMGACRAYGVELIGGDTSAAPRDLVLSITLLGRAVSGPPLRRDGARIGDLVYVTGTLGDSRAGLDVLAARADKARKRSLHRELPPRAVRYLIHRHLHPTPRIVEAQYLVRHRLATAAIDLSDGLSGDLVHLCDQSGVGVEIESAALPLSPACRQYAAVRRLDAPRLALAGGEDYELLFTVAPNKKAALERLATQKGFRFSRIGIIRSQSCGRRLRTGARAIQPMPMLSYRHFQKN